MNPTTNKGIITAAAIVPALLSDSGGVEIVLWGRGDEVVCGLLEVVV
jgi:hypothetical protein